MYMTSDLLNKFNWLDDIPSFEKVYTSILHKLKKIISKELALNEMNRNRKNSLIPTVSFLINSIYMVWISDKFIFYIYFVSKVIKIICFKAIYVTSNLFITNLMDATINHPRKINVNIIETNIIIIFYVLATIYILADNKFSIVILTKSTFNSNTQHLTTNYDLYLFIYFVSINFN